MQKGTASCLSRCHYPWVRHKKTKKESNEATRAIVTKEMEKPRMARSARIVELKLDAARIPKQLSVTLPGTVQIIPSPGPSQPEKAQIRIVGADPGYRELRIENTLTDENGGDVRLKNGAHVQVTVRAGSDTSVATIDERLRSHAPDRI